MLLGAVNRRGVLAGVAQLVEQLTCNQQVGGPNPLAGSRNIKGFQIFWKLFFYPAPQHSHGSA